MKYPKNIFFYLIIGLLLCLYSCSSAPLKAGEETQKIGWPKEDLKVQVRKWNDAMEVAYNAGKLEEVAAIYADDAILLGPNDYRVEGKEEVLKYWTGSKHPPVSWKLDIYALGKTEAELMATPAYQNMSPTPPKMAEKGISITEGADVVFQLGHSSLTRNINGKDRTSEVDFIVIWRKQKENRYKIWVDLYW